MKRTTTTTSARALLVCLSLVTGLTSASLAQARSPQTSQSASKAPAKAAPTAESIISGLAAGAKKGEAPSPARLEEIYDDVWFRLGETYIDTAKMANWGEWRHKYDGKLKTEQDLDGALNAMALSLDDTWTGYESSHQRLLATFATVRGLVDLGVAIKVDAAGNHVVKIAPFGSLAYDNGIVAGDVLLTVNGKSLAGLSQTELDEAMRVEVTKPVNITYIPGGAIGDDGHATIGGEVKSLTFKAVPSTAPLAEARMLANDVMYARLSSFRDGPLDIGVLNKSVTELLATCHCQPRGLVLDLRGNPGGSFELVLKEAAFFMPGRVIVRSATREGNLITESTYRAQALTSYESASLSDAQRKMIALFSQAPMVVLVDASTASAAELITGAFKDSHRAVVVGIRTYGKGVGFDEIDVPLGGGLTVTKLRYSTPAGFDVSIGGIEPDITVVQPRGVKITTADDAQLRAALAELEKLIAGRTTP